MKAKLAVPSIRQGIFDLAATLVAMILIAVQINKLTNTVFFVTLFYFNNAFSCNCIKNNNKKKQLIQIVKISKNL